MAKAPEPEQRPLRLLVYDRTCRGRGPLPGLSHAWQLGGALYSLLGRFDGRIGVRSWGEALDWLAKREPSRPIGEVQYWGHGKWGAPRICGESLNEMCLLRDHQLRAPLETVAKRMLPGDAGLWWFRTCESFGAVPGQRFAQAFTDVIGCRAAGHTFIIGPVQSGLHSLGPGETPSWSPEEALLEGTAEQPKRAAWSALRLPNTVTCLTGRIPAGY